jgi:hypothetical protein
MGVSGGIAETGECHPFCLSPCLFTNLSLLPRLLKGDEQMNKGADTKKRKKSKKPNKKEVRMNEEDA